MKYKFEETHIPEDFSLILAKQNYLLGPPNTHMVAHVLVDATSRYLGSAKNPMKPKALIFRSSNGNFILGAKVEYIRNEDNPNDPSAGKWDYTWTFYEEDLDACDGIEKIEFNNDNMVTPFFRNSGIDLHGMKFVDSDSTHVCINMIAEMISKWLDDNATANEETTLVLPGVFTAIATINEDGVVEKGFIPDGEMKILIKDDSAIQEQ